jgi:hypothetical protein
MRTDVDTVAFALSLFRQSSVREGPCLCGVAQDIRHQLAYTEPVVFEHAQQAARLYQYIAQDVWNISTILDRLEWMKNRSAEDKELEARWWNYAAVDIQSFHVELRSVLDYVADLIRIFAPEPGQVSDSGSFRKLLKWIGENPNRLQREVAELTLEQREWFGEVRAVRDTLLHQGGQTIVFGSALDGILFQAINVRFKALVDKPFLMYNENVVHFDRYAALYTARLLAYLEDLSQVYVGKHETKLAATGVENHASGYSVMVDWMQNLRHRP